MSEHQWTLLIAIVAPVLTGLVFAGLTAYLKERGKNLATKQDIKFLQQELAENTRITKGIEQKYSKEYLLWQSELSYREQQLSELYGPAYGYVKSQRDIYALWTGHKMQEVNLQVKQILFKQNQIMRDLIIQKAHLIEGATMPESFVRFFTCTQVWGMYAAPTESGVVPAQLKTDERTAYPKEFDAHIIQTTEQLKRRIETLHAKYAEPLPTAT